MKHQFKEVKTPENAISEYSYKGEIEGHIIESKHPWGDSYYYLPQVLRLFNF